MTRDQIIGEKAAAYYTERFDKFESNPTNKVSWNWFAFLLSWIWMLYRKMYAEGIIALVLCGIISQVFPVLELPFAILCGLFGNYLYYRYVVRTVDGVSFIESMKKTFGAK